MEQKTYQSNNKQTPWPKNLTRVFVKQLLFNNIT